MSRSATSRDGSGSDAIIGTPAVARDLKTIGFDVMSRANNHATDWGLEGMRQTSRALDEAGIVHAGVGEHRAEARGARYFDTGKYKMDSTTATDGEFNAMWNQLVFGGDVW